MAPKTSKNQTAGQLTPHPYDMSLIPDSLYEDFASEQTLFEAQRPIIQRFLETQAQALSDILMTSASQVRFKLPDEVVVDAASGQTAAIPPDSREQSAGGLLSSLTHSDLRTSLRQYLLELEGSGSQGLAVAASLIRYATATHLVHRVLPAGRAVVYALLKDEEIPSIPLGEAGEVESAITAETDAIAESGAENEKRGELLVPYVPVARRFYLPQWVAFDDEGHLLMNSVQEAEAQIASMQRFILVLHTAVSLAPYIVADEEYQRKRYGILGQLANQGRALAYYQTMQIVEIIQQRASRGDLNRGLSLSLPYFDDQELQVKLRHFEVIPSGRIMFVPAFIVHAAREEQAKIAQDTRLSASTRKYLLTELEMLEEAFLPDSERYQ